MQDLWNEICFLIDRYRQTDSDERYFQIEAENIFEKLGWSRYKGEITSQQVINVGSAHTVRPDIVISDGSERIFTVELKRPNAGFIDRNADQLISYMRLLRLNFGLLLGDSIRVFYDVPTDKEDPIEIINIPFEENNSDGVKLLEIIARQNYSSQKLTEYCERRVELIDAKRNAGEIINMLCSKEGNDYISKIVKQSIAETKSEDIADIVVKDLSFYACRKDRQSAPKNDAITTFDQAHPYVTSQRSEREHYRKYKWNPNERVASLELHPRDGESFQDYVKRTMQLAFSNNMISNDELEKLQDLAYSKTTFGLAYPLLVQGKGNISDRTGRPRYWSKPIYNDYFCCSQWWKAKIPQHEKLFTKWVNRINSENVS